MAVHDKVLQKCSLCDFETYVRSSLYSHVSLVHNGRERTDGGTVKCQNCNKQFKSTHSRDEHIAIVHDKIKWICQHCGKGFSFKKGLSTHIKAVHDGIKHKCPHCDYMANQKNHLPQHIKTVHEGIRFECPQCQNRFTLKSNLKVHIRDIHQKIQCTELYSLPMYFTRF